ncbi:MAG: uroporphyrinogen decarboxylase, partial [Gemmatimonadetes bacterium]|nr:uroporphyrinogen decarboxylase [Gemmatimonadota bacterium]NIS00558.1 uroporphyrinogen decarboxylase [Gemmatimonadota bacterium]NIT66220.1 uroporphyrinogen decarboxylase [Gemmatimonadota bacterium]NIU54311.1 uroporphyrinogen decarboxylase [Gemmatimonadota bacterium]NIV22780.1 uroporphyrinogen decarboxylase [Gemmatimonadota bacterium]
EAGGDVIGVDWRIPIGDARRTLGDGIAVQGNLDPTLLFAPLDTLRDRVVALLEEADPERGYIFNLGHGILPETPFEAVDLVVETVHG